LLLKTPAPALLSGKTLEKQVVEKRNHGAEVLEQDVPIYFTILCVAGHRQLQIRKA
jgi:hypothetical protein